MFTAETASKLMTVEIRNAIDALNAKIREINTPNMKQSQAERVWEGERRLLILSVELLKRGHKL